MTSHAPRRAAPTSEPGMSFATGVALCAGILMVVGGVCHALAGIAALFNDPIYVQAPNYVYKFDVTSWGWIHLVLGVLVAVAGVGVIRGQKWARAVGIGLVSLSLIANFLFIPYYPLWSLALATLDVVVIWGLANDTRAT